MLIAALPLMVAEVLPGQSISTHPAPWLKEAVGNLFFRLDSDGDQLLVNRSPSIEREELVLVPTAGGTETVWYSNAGRSIYNQIALSGEGDMVIFAKSPGSRVYAVTEPNGTPKVVADAAPYGDIRQLRVSNDGKWVAFTASSGLLNSPTGRVHANLYVAATDGSVVHRITGISVPMKLIPFDLSPDGGTLVWVDDPGKGPWVAGIDGSNAKRLSVSGSSIVAVTCNTTGSVIYYQVLDANGANLYRVNRDGTNISLVHSAARGTYYVARNGSRVRLDQFDPKAKPCGSSWLVEGSSLNAMFTFGRPGIAGSRAWSGDGRVMVWRARFSPWADETRIWRAEQ